MRSRLAGKEEIDSREECVLLRLKFLQSTDFSVPTCCAAVALLSTRGLLGIYDPVGIHEENYSLHNYTQVSFISLSSHQVDISVSRVYMIF